MFMQPNQGWRWYFDKEADRLCITLDDDLHFKTHYKGKQLCPIAHQSQAFSTEDCKNYNLIAEMLLGYKLLPRPLLVQTVLNAVAAKRFLLPVMPKSWFFAPGSSQVAVCEDLLIELSTVAGQLGQFIVLESNEQASLCMLVDETLRLNDTKTMAMFDVIKVMNDRVIGFVSASDTDEFFKLA
ncbi:cell division protein ZapC domain-containing protein [Corallincola platygyrae]|uniref:Cell division protein ZapC n=1 Tax=Corallincola platygyrae TaxID=1193278 RepID=A0ABW4XK76_9GAMM